jgi:hypothetical protein
MGMVYSALAPDVDQELFLPDPLYPTRSPLLRLAHNKGDGTIHSSSKLPPSHSLI